MKYSKSIIILIFAVAFVSTKIYGVSLSGKCEISGIVKDSANNEGLPFASVQVLAINDSSLIKGTMTNVDGKYLIKDVQTGEYIMMVSYMGYTECKKK